MKKIMIMLLSAAMIISLVSCSESAEQTGTDGVSTDLSSAVSNTESADTSTSFLESEESEAFSEVISSDQQSTVSSNALVSSESESSDKKEFGEIFTEGDDNFSATDLTTYYTSEDTSIKLNGNTVTVNGNGASFANKRISITSAGTYVLSGTLSDGQIYVNVSKEEKVHLVFDGVNITNTTTACVYVDSCDKTVITLAKGSKNTLTDCKAYIFDSPAKTKPNSCIYSDDDLTINGSGSLTVNAKYNNGIATDNDLTIVGANITVNAVNNALKGDYSFVCKDCDITITTTGESSDGIKVEDDYRKDKGYIYIESGNFNITVSDDAFQAVTSITVLPGTKITTNCDGDDFNCGDTGVISVPDGILQ